MNADDIRNNPIYQVVYDDEISVDSRVDMIADIIFDEGEERPVLTDFTRYLEGRRNRFIKGISAQMEDGYIFKASDLGYIRSKLAEDYTACGILARALEEALPDKKTLKADPFFRQVSTRYFMSGATAVAVDLLVKAAEEDKPRLTRELKVQLNGLRTVTEEDLRLGAGVHIGQKLKIRECGA